MFPRKEELNKCGKLISAERDFTAKSAGVGDVLARQPTKSRGQTKEGLPSVVLCIVCISLFVGGSLLINVEK